jgi:hypothetical protein
VVKSTRTILMKREAPGQSTTGEYVTAWPGHFAMVFALAHGAHSFQDFGAMSKQA